MFIIFEVHVVGSVTVGLFFSPTLSLVATYLETLAGINTRGIK